MHEFFPLFSQAAIVAFQAAWLTMAVSDNLRHPNIDERGFKRVLTMDLVAQQDPGGFKDVSKRRVENPRMEKTLFRTLVAAEVIVSALLWVGSLGLLMAAVGVIGHGGAQALASMAVLGFTAIWASLLTGGLWFLDRVGMFPAVQVHFFLTIWGVATLTFLAASP
jgi:predicted small integral membrane protein